MRVQEQPAYVLHRRNYSESSLLVEVLTREHGRVGVLARAARGTKSALPALLQPFQELSLDYAGTGELQLLRRAEAIGPAALPQGEAALAGLYYNELLMRLTPRHDGHPALYARYAQALGGLVSGPSLAFAVRRFERALLDELGYGVDFTHAVDGVEIEPEQHYELISERGFVAVAGDGYSGRALLAMASDEIPASAELRQLRQLFRQLIQAHLTGEPLRSWSLMAQLR
jgi:DNA repair protein RecO (recombination protein O)